MTIREIEKALLMKREPVTSIPSNDFASTGITPLNLAITGHPARGIAKGQYVFLVGDSSAGKTLFAMTFLDEIVNNPEFDDYQIIYDPVEDGALMNIRKMFSRNLASRIRTVNGGTWKERNASELVSDFYDNAEEAVAAGPCVYVLDSMDSLETRQEKAINESNREARKKGNKVKESYALTKPKENSARLRVLKNKLKKNGSILIIISQTRQNISHTSRFEPKTRSGGDALRFYCRIEMWLSLKERIREEIGKEKLQVGQKTKIKIKKNHFSGWEGEITVPIYRKVGIDDLGCCIDYLVDWGHWKISKGVIDAVEFDVKMKREPLARFIEVADLHKDLQKIVARYWREVEERVLIRRKKRHE